MKKLILVSMVGIFLAMQALPESAEAKSTGTSDTGPGCGGRMSGTSSVGTCTATISMVGWKPSRKFWGGLENLIVRRPMRNVGVGHIVCSN